MNSSFVSIGIDISKDWLEAHDQAKNTTSRHANTTEGIGALIKEMTKQNTQRKADIDILVCEPSGGYERLLMAFLHDANLPVALVNARQVRDFAGACGVLAKTDRLDARVLAAYGETLRPQPTRPKPTRQLADYVTRRRQIVDTIRREKVHRHH